MTCPRLLVLALFCMVPLAAWCAEDAVARSLAATCANCHGTEGRAVSPGIPSLAGMRRDKIVADMKAFKAGTRPATVMHQLARGYTDEQIARVAAYFAAHKE